MNRRQLARAAAILGLTPWAAGSAPARAAPTPEVRRRAEETAAGSAPSARQALYADHAAAQSFAAQLATRHGWEARWVMDHLSQARRLPAVQRLIMPAPAGTAKNWQAYRARFIDAARVQAGLRFWRAHAQALARAQARYGVPAELVVSIIGIETFYGRHLGAFRLIDALATLSFDFPSGRSDRSAFFRDELEALFVLSRREGVDPKSYRGSFAGAWGLPQFMPSSILRYAVDFDGDGHVQLISSPADVVGSVAHYLERFGWQSGMPTHYAVVPPEDDRERARLLQPDIVPSFTAEQMEQAGARLSPEGRAHQGPLALVELQNGEAPSSFVAGTQNFYVVTRYNWSSYYALAVIDLATELARSRQP